jgi:hypothetical protein
MEDKKRKQLIKNMAVIIDHEAGCCWYASDSDMCNCSAEMKARKILAYLKKEEENGVEEAVLKKKAGRKK